MHRVQVTQPYDTVSVAGNEYQLDEKGRIEVPDSQIEHFKAHPHLFKIIGPDQVQVPKAGLQGPKPDGNTPKGLKPIKV